MTFLDPEFIDPVVHCFAKCLWCKAFVPIRKDESGNLVLDERNCPKCGAEISQDQLANSFASNFIHTQAVTSSNKFISLDLAVVPFLACSILLIFMNFPLWIRIPFMLVYHLPIVLAINWFRKYWYYFRFPDEEYMNSVRQMRRFLLIWMAANVINWLLIVGEVYLEE